MLHYERLTSTLQENVCELTEEKYQKKNDLQGNKIWKW